MENMIKKGFFMIAALILIVPAVLAADSSADSYTMPSNPDCIGITGDLNGDGLINEYDEEVIRYMILGQEPYSACADLDNDGIVSPSDFSMLKVTEIEIERHGIVLEPVSFADTALDATREKGDINGDGKIDYIDAGLLKEMIMGEIPPSSFADVNGDGTVSPNDYIIVQCISLGIYYNLELYDGNDSDSTAAEDNYTMPSNPNCAGLTGDLNGDGLINTYDGEVIAYMITGVEPYSACADLDNDGIVSPSDFSMLKVTEIEIERHGIVLEPKALPALDASGSECRKGDVNADGKVDYKDLGLVKEMVAGTVPSSMCADTDNDLIISPNDVTIINEMALGLYIERDPYIHPVGNFSINESETLTFQVNATDMENDDIIYSAENLPEGAVFDSQTFSWTPDSTQSGNYTVTFIADDGYGSSEINVSIEVKNVNARPEFEQIDNITIHEAETAWFMLNATDSDGDNITYSAENLPEGAYFWTDELGGIFSGTFVWNPQYGQAGNYTVTFTASDGQLNTAMDVNIEVLAVPAEEQMHVVLAADAANGTENLTVNFTCTVNNGTGPYSYSWNVMDNSTNGTVYAGMRLPVDASYMQFNTTLDAGNWTAVCYVSDSLERTVISNEVIVSVSEPGNQDDQGEDDDDQGEDNNDQDNDNDEEDSGGDHHSSSGILYAPKTASGSTQTLKLVEKDGNSDADTQTPAEPDNNKEGLMTITGEAVQETENGLSALNIAGIMLWIFAVLLAGIIVYGKVQQRKTADRGFDNLMR